MKSEVCQGNQPSPFGQLNFADDCILDNVLCFILALKGPQRRICTLQVAQAQACGRLGQVQPVSEAGSSRTTQQQ